MSANRSVVIRFHANIERYQIKVYDGDESCEKRIIAREDCLCFCPCNPCIRIVATPLVEGYATTLYFWVDVTCRRVIDLYFSFPVREGTTSIKRFTLTDATYGLPIDGALTFVGR